VTELAKALFREAPPSSWPWPRGTRPKPEGRWRGGSLSIASICWCHGDRRHVGAAPPRLLPA